MTRISVVIPNLNSTFIDRTLLALHAQQFDLSQVDVLVVGLDVPCRVCEDSLVRFISTGRPVNPAVARNLGIQAAQGQIICFTDADCLPAPTWLAQLTAPLLREEAHVVGGGITFERANYWTWCDNLCWFHEFLAVAPAGERGLLPSLNLAVRRTVIDKVGLFNENYPKAGGEDAEWTTRMRLAGYTLHFEPTAIVKHCPNRSNLASIWQHGLIYGRFSVKLNRKYTNFLQTPYFLQNVWLLMLMTPLLTFGSALRSVRCYPHLSGYLALPGAVVGKLAWCVGAVYRLRQQKNQPDLL